MTIESRPPWRSAPYFVLRLAGFPFDYVADLAAPAAAAQAAAMRDAVAALRAGSASLRTRLAELGIRDAGTVNSLLGQGRPLPARVVKRMPDSAARDAVREYQRQAVSLQQRWSEYADALDAVLHRQRNEVVSLFRADPFLREVLLLSNDAQFTRFDSWLSDFNGDTTSQSARRMIDLLVMYLQRVAAKNETNSHFGPIALGRIRPRSRGITFTEGTEPMRRAYFAHWAAEEIGRQLARLPVLYPYLRPRRRPGAFLTGTTVTVYDSATTSGMPSDWRFVELSRHELNLAERWVFERSDGDRTVRGLAAEWQRAGFSDRLEPVISGLVDRGIVFCHYEIPVGEPEPLAYLLKQISADLGGTAESLRDALRDLNTLVGRFAIAPSERRHASMTAVTAAFERLTGCEPHRLAGRHYADRTVLYEECHAPVEEIIAGGDIEELITSELAIVYDLFLTPVRYRMRREHQILADYITETFGAGVRVRLADFFRAYCADRAELTRQCEGVDRELAGIREELTTLLVSQRWDDAEIGIDRASLEEFLGRFPRDPAALCNPDVMIAAEDPAAIARGELLAVVGDCHAMRELITHSSFAPILEELAPSIGKDIEREYAACLAGDEMLCEVVRSHPAKTAVHLPYAGPDIEFLGLSRKPRTEVIAAEQLLVCAENGQARLYADGWERAIRLTAPPATGPSIARDPLAAFSFPRFFGGFIIDDPDKRHIPRIRCGRVVIQRELWRVDTAELFGGLPAGVSPGGSAADFYCATRLRANRKLPDVVYAKIPGEPKPIFVHFDAPLLVRQLCRLARRAAEPVIFTEMLPGPDQLWLSLDGKRRTSELRCGLFSPAAAHGRRSERIDRGQAAGAV